MPKYFYTIVCSIAFFFIACDQVKDDKLPETSQPDTTTTQIALVSRSVFYTEPRNTLAISLLSSDLYSASTSLKIESQPTYGAATLQSDGILLYVPNEKTVQAEDYFTISSRSNNTTKTDSIKVIINSRLDNAPCNGGSIGDRFTLKKNQAKTELDVLKNDLFCTISINTASLKIKLYPKFGFANINNGMIYYQPAKDFVGRDELIYEICSLGDKPICRAGFVHINVVDEQTSGTCSPIFNEDDFFIKQTTMIPSSFTMTFNELLSNDVLCNPIASLNIIITKQPKDGKIVVDNTQRTLTYTPMGGGKPFDRDEFDYIACVDNTCAGQTIKEDGEVHLLFEKGRDCVFELKDDNFMFSLKENVPSIPTLGAGTRDLRIFDNDAICDPRIQFRIKEQPTGGTLTLVGPKVFYTPKTLKVAYKDKFVYEMTIGGQTKTANVNVQFIE